MTHRVLFPLEFQKVLISREADQARLVKLMHQRGYRVSKQFVSFMATGKNRVPAGQLRRMCEVLQLDEAERRRLHKAAAIDYGFELGGLDG